MRMTGQERALRKQPHAPLGGPRHRGADRRGARRPRRSASRRAARPRRVRGALSVAAPQGWSRAPVDPPAPGNATVSNYGLACVSRVGTPQFVTKGGPPALGNLSFAFNVSDAPVGNNAVIFISTGSQTLPVAGYYELWIKLLEDSLRFTVGK